MLNFKKIFATAAVAVAAVVSLTGCGNDGPPDLTPENVLGKNWETAYLKVNDKSVVCYRNTNSYSNVCEWSNVSIPNGLEVVELTNEIPDNKSWKLRYIVTLKNETVPCVTYSASYNGSCDFKAESSSGYGEADSNSSATNPTSEQSEAVTPSANPSTQSSSAPSTAPAR